MNDLWRTLTQLGIVAAGYLLTFWTSTLLVRRAVRWASAKKSASPKRDTRNPNVGLIVGICENFIIVTFILMNAITGLSLVFAAKAVLRHDKVSENPEYYLVGTMVNFTWSVFMALLLKWAMCFC